MGRDYLPESHMLLPDISVVVVGTGHLRGKWTLTAVSPCRYCTVPHRIHLPKIPIRSACGITEMSQFESNTAKVSIENGDIVSAARRGPA